MLLSLLIALFVSYCSIGFCFVQKSKSVVAFTQLKAATHNLVVWDCDGVLVDSEALLKQGEVEALAKAGITVTVDDCVRLFSGFSPDTATTNFEVSMKRSLPPNFFKDQIEGSMQLFRDRLIPLMDKTVLKLHEQNINMCVASGSPRPRVDLSILKAGMLPAFPPHKIFTREEVKRGKPAPDLFLHAANKMGVDPSKCVVVEDAVAGIEAAIAANMKVIGYLGGGHAQAAWYREKILAYDIPIAYTQEEVYAYLLEYVS
jgi:HAD superfamily hydrolase (TIGR01509 family)